MVDAGTTYLRAAYEILSASSERIRGLMKGAISPLRIWIGALSSAAAASTALLAQLLQARASDLRILATGLPFLARMIRQVPRRDRRRTWCGGVCWAGGWVLCGVEGRKNG